MRLFRGLQIESWPFLILLFILIYGLDLIIARDLWVQDEARYGEIVREMIEHGYWFIPHLNGHPYPDKPVLYFWLVAALGALIGQGELSFRILTVLSTAGAGFGVYRVAGQLLDKSSAWWASAIFLTAFLTLIVGHIIRMDMLLTAIIIAAWSNLIKGRAHTPALNLFWFFTLLGLAVKGPIAFLFTLLPGLIWYLWEDGIKGIRALRILRGLSILAILIIIWIALVIFSGAGEYLRQIWQEQLVGRAINSWSHREPAWFYLALLPLLFMPWTPLIPLGLKFLWREIPFAARSILSFTLPPLIAISLISGKLFIYLEPIIPGLALIAASAINHLPQEVRRGLMIPAVVFFILLAGIVGYVTQRYLECPGREFGWIAVLILLGCARSAARPISSGRKWVIRQLSLALVLSWILFGLLIKPLNPLYSGRAIGEYLAQEIPQTTPIGIVHSTRGIFNYYARRIFSELTPEAVANWRIAHPSALLIVPAGLIPGISLPDCERIRAFRVELIEYHLFHCGTQPKS